MSEFRAKVKMLVNVKEFVKQADSFIGFLTSLIGDPDLGVIVTDIDEIAVVSSHEYEARVHVKVRTPPEFDNVEPQDYCRIHMTDEDYGFSVVGVEIAEETN